MSLSTDQPQHAGSKAKLLHQQKSIDNRRDVTKVPSGNNDKVRQLPSQLLGNFNTDGLLSFDAERVHGVGKINGTISSYFLDDLHAAVEIGIDRKGDRPVGQRLNQLGNGYFV